MQLLGKIGSPSSTPQKATSSYFGNSQESSVTISSNSESYAENVTSLKEKSVSVIFREISCQTEGDTTVSCSEVGIQTDKVPYILPHPAVLHVVENMLDIVCATS